jgi:hypothetical protein
MHTPATANSVKPERSVTRTLCILLGIFIVFCPSEAVLFHFSIFQHDVATSSKYLTALFFLMVQLSGLMGATFIWVGIVGVAPSWLRQSKASSRGG